MDVINIIINIIKEQPFIFSILAITLIGYFYFNQKSKYGNHKTDKEIANMSEEERAKYKQEQKKEKYNKSKRKNINYSERHSSVYDERHYDFAPKDGTSIYRKGLSSVSQKKKNITSKAMERLPEYKHYLEDVKEKNLNHLARNLELINSDCADDIKLLQKKGYFQNITVDESYCKIIYNDLNSDNNEEINDFENINSPYEILQKDFEGEHVHGINITHNCPHCGTPNIIDTDTFEYNCYYCLDKVFVKERNKK